MSFEAPFRVGFAWSNLGDKMRAVRLVEPGKRLEAREVDPGLPGAFDAVVAVRAAGICRSDVHYRSGWPVAGPLPLTLGHEIAGAVHAVGDGVTSVAPGDRVVVHYQVACGDCEYCRRGSEQFCPAGAMLGKDRDGGYAEFVTVPARNLFSLPDSVPMTHGAVMMCSSATVYHALRKARLRSGEAVAVIGVGGLGASAVQLARAFGAAAVFAVDINREKLTLAEGYGAIAVDGNGDAAATILAQGGVDVSLELIGLESTTRTAIDVLRPFGRAVAVGLTHDPVPVRTYRDLVVREAELIGSADHLASEIPDLLRLAAEGSLDLTAVVTNEVELDADAVNAAMDEVEQFGASVRTVIVS